MDVSCVLGHAADIAVWSALWGRYLWFDVKLLSTPRSGRSQRRRPLAQLTTPLHGAIAPPFGYVLFAVKAAAPQVSNRDIFGASWPFVGLTLMGMLVLIIFPQIVTFLPNLLRPN